MGHYRQAVQLLTEMAFADRQGHRAGQHLDRAPAAAVGHSACPQRRRAGERPKQSPAPTGASTMPWPNRCRTRIAAASTICSSVGTTAKRLAGWRLRQSPVKPNSRHMLEHIERLKAWQALDLPSGIGAVGAPEPPAQDRP